MSLNVFQDLRLSLATAAPVTFNRTIGPCDDDAGGERCKPRGRYNTEAIVERDRPSDNSTAIASSRSPLSTPHWPWMHSSSRVSLKSPEEAIHAG
jgi:hypothetical protein